MQNRFLGALMALMLCVYGCGDKVTVNPTTKGEAGESCTRRDDCAKDLTCIAGRCAAAGDNDGEDGGQPAASGGKSGESCTWRGDCEPGLACIDQTCVEDATTAEDSGMPAQRRGDRGETCTARNDCKEDLACVAGRCRENDYDISAQAKGCFRVDCAADTDCCKTFVAPSFCGSLKTQCDAGTTSACTSYANSCVCRRVCQDQLCATNNSCTTVNDCSFALPFCVNQKCAQCTVKADCANPLADCVEGACKVACTRNEECPMFSDCQSGKCVHVGCKSNRECYFSTQDPRSQCIETECQTPCDNDAECTVNAFQICEKGRCVDSGCESDAECRVRLNLNDQTNTTATAVCKLPK